MVFDDNITLRASFKQKSIYMYNYLKPSLMNKNHLIAFGKLCSLVVIATGGLRIATKNKLYI